MKRIEIFRPGAFTPMAGSAPLEFSAAQLRTTAVAYDPAKAEAPVVVGHPAIDAPAFGWVKALDFADGALGAYVDDLVPEFVEQLKAKRFKRVSASFFPPEATSNPKPGVYYLRHVGFLGAAAPAVPGLKSVSFADVPLSFSVEGDIAPEAPGTMGLAELRQRLEEHQAQATKGFIDQLVAEARLPASLAPLVWDIMRAASGAGTVSFGEGDAAETLSFADGMKRLLSGLPPMVQLGEFAATKDDVTAGTRPASLRLPRGYEVDPDRLALVSRADAVVRQRGVSFAEALVLLEGGS